MITRQLSMKILSGYTAREETFAGQAYVVAPVVALVEGVHTGLDGIPTFYSSALIESGSPAFDDVPLTIPNHPPITGGGQWVNAPGIREEFQVGYFRNIRAQGSKLTGEIWICVERAQRLYPAILQAVRSGQPIEVSTGLFVNVDQTPGNWNGEAYQESVNAYRLDHLALLPEAQGACSVSDGCGVRPNAQVPISLSGYETVNVEAIPSGLMVDVTSIMADTGERTAIRCGAVEALTENEESLKLYQQLLAGLQS